VWLHGQVKTPPMSAKARVEAGYLLRCLQSGQALSWPHARPMPTICPGCLELRVTDADGVWRIILRPDPDAIVVLEVFMKKTAKTPPAVITMCRARIRRYDRDALEGADHGRP
jgi:phage-related protein